MTLNNMVSFQVDKNYTLETSRNCADSHTRKTNSIQMFLLLRDVGNIEELLMLKVLLDFYLLRSLITKGEPNRIYILMLFMLSRNKWWKINMTQFIGNENINCKFDISRFVYSQRRLLGLLLAIIVKFSHKMLTISNFLYRFQ